MKLSDKFSISNYFSTHHIFLAFNLIFAEIAVWEDLMSLSSLKLMLRYADFLFLKSALSGLRQFLAIESPLKMIKNAVISLLKLTSFSRYLNFCLEFLVT